MKNTRLISLLAAGALFSAASASASVVVAYWAQNDNDLPGGGFGFIEGAFPQAADIGSGALTVGGGLLLDTVVNANDDTVHQWVPSFIGTTVNAQDGFEGGGSLSIQGGTVTDGMAANNGSWWQVEVSMSGLTDLVFSFAARGTSSGFNNNQLSYSTDGVYFTNFGDPFNSSQTSFLAYEFALGDLLDNEASVFLRVTLDGATGATGNNRFDNITVTAIPEPSTYAMLFGALALAIVALRRVRR
ncbi:MAG: PEP-CTERM sorting domain-containing protein [Puniceicoccaceae bacterium]|nr:MAG: PEP-CTERM sorting domain-containing protein [Puniceicoccaceae bacterium]